MNRITEDHKSETAMLLDQYEISNDDLGRVRSFGETLVQNWDPIVDSWYDWLRTHPEFDQFFPNQEMVEHVQKRQFPFWRRYFQGDIDDDYVEQRRHLGGVHARIGLPLATYLMGQNHWLELFSIKLVEAGHSQDTLEKTMRAMTRLLMLDTSVVVEAYTQIHNETMAEQTRSLMEMSTPVTQIWSGILLLPLVGIIDSKRAQDVMQATLAKISQTTAKVLVLDIIGVPVVDTAVANHLIKITRATRLMGCNSIISGISPAIAQTITELGIDVGTVRTTATMQDALSGAFRQTGLDIVEAR